MRPAIPAHGPNWQQLYWANNYLLVADVSQWVRTTEGGRPTLTVAQQSVTTASGIGSDSVCLHPDLVWQSEFCESVTIYELTHRVRLQCGPEQRDSATRSVS